MQNLCTVRPELHVEISMLLTQFLQNHFQRARMKDELLPFCPAKLQKDCFHYSSVVQIGAKTINALARTLNK